MPGILRNQRLALICATVLTAGALSAPPAARAFTFEDGKGNAIPKFDLEEQARQFRKPEADVSAVDKKGLDTPFGKLQFGVQQNDSMFGYRSPFVSGSGSGNADRRHYERMFTPGYIQGRGD
jgi:hypothetical protein